jgi:hypothetical protein
MSMGRSVHVGLSENVNIRKVSRRLGRQFHNVTVVNRETSHTLVKTKTGSLLDK